MFINSSVIIFFFCGFILCTLFVFLHPLPQKKRNVQFVSKKKMLIQLCVVPEAPREGRISFLFYAHYFVSGKCQHRSLTQPCSATPAEASTHQTTTRRGRERRVNTFCFFCVLFFVFVFCRRKKQCTASADVRAFALSPSPFHTTQQKTHFICFRNLFFKFPFPSKEISFYF